MVGMAILVMLDQKALWYVSLTSHSLTPSSLPLSFSLKGPPGNRGAPGVAGQKGSDGVPGPDGAPGDIGVVGQVVSIAYVRKILARRLLRRHIKVCAIGTIQMYIQVHISCCGIFMLLSS